MAPILECQKIRLVECMSTHYERLSKRSPNKIDVQYKKSTWSSIVNDLNSLGVKKTLVQWKAIWAKIKKDASDKVVFIKQYQRRTNKTSDCPIILTTYEEDILKIINGESAAPTQQHPSSNTIALTTGTKLTSGQSRETTHADSMKPSEELIANRVIPRTLTSATSSVANEQSVSNRSQVTTRQTQSDLKKNGSDVEDSINRGTYRESIRGSPHHRESRHRSPHRRKSSYRSPDRLEFIQRSPHHRESRHRSPHHRKSSHRSSDRREFSQRSPHHRESNQRSPDRRKLIHRHSHHRESNQRSPDRRESIHRNSHHRCRHSCNSHESRHRSSRHQSGGCCFSKSRNSRGQCCQRSLVQYKNCCGPICANSINNRGGTCNMVNMCLTEIKELRSVVEMLIK